jgi:8-oxo-dGTP pyrophosphatase MutT (NUDIX family)
MNVDKNDPNVARESLKNPKRNVAVIGLLNDDSILLVRTKRFPEHWQPIGGGVKSFDKSPIETLMREVKEETGLSLNEHQIIYELETNYDFGEGTVFFFTANLDASEHIVFDESELAEWGWFKLTEAKSLNMFPATQKFLDHLLHSRFLSKN